MDRSTIRVALRTLARHKGFTTVAVLSLGVAIALNTVMYSVTTAIVEPEISVREPENLYTFKYSGNFKRVLTPDDIETALLAGNKELIGVTGFTNYALATRRGAIPMVEANDKVRRLQSVMVVRPNYFDFLGTPMLQGRSFRASDEAENSTPAVITRRLAEYLFPGSSAIGQQILLDGNGYTVIGVYEYVPRFALLGSDIFILRPAASSPVRMNLLRFARKLPLYSMNEQFKLAAARLALAAGEPTSETAFAGKPVFVPGKYNVLGGLRFALVAAVVAVLLVACANLANLQLARGLARSRELALRAAVGASRRQLIQLLTLETGILALGGLVLGVVLTLWGIYIVKATIPEVIADFFIAPRVSWAVFVFAALAAIMSLILVGLVPAVRISRVDPNEMLKAGAGTGASRQHRRRYGLMVIAQIGFALPVLIGSMLLVRGSYKLHSRHYMATYAYGYDPTPIVVASLPIVHDPARRSPSLLTIADEVQNRALAVPGVVEAAIFTTGYGRDAIVTSAELNGDQKERMANRMTFRIVSPSFFRVMGREIIKGRSFNEADVDGKSIVIDQGTAKYLFGDQDPIGRQVMFAARSAKGLWHTVIGVVGDKRSWADIERANPYAGFEIGEVYRGIGANDTVAFYRRTSSVQIYARSEGNTELASLRVLRNLRSIRGAERPIAEPLVHSMGITYMRQAIDFLAGLFSTFAMVGIALVAIGVYSIVAHSVEERRRELAVRISMGATMRDILRAVLREGNVLILGGVAIGLLFAKYGIWWMSDFLDPDDITRPMLYAYVATGLFALAVFAAFIPALRATRIDPVEALRHE